MDHNKTPALDWVRKVLVAIKFDQAVEAARQNTDGKHEMGKSHFPIPKEERHLFEGVTRYQLEKLLDNVVGADMTVRVYDKPTRFRRGNGVYAIFPTKG